MKIKKLYVTDIFIDLKVATVVVLNMKECLINSNNVDIICRRNNLLQTSCLLAGSMHVMICLLWKPESTVFSILILILNLIQCKFVSRQSHESYLTFNYQ